MLPSEDVAPTDTARWDDLAWQALQHYGLARATLTLLRQGDNTVYRVETLSGQRLALRLHTATRHTLTALNSELSWLDRLGRVAGLPVPQPVRSRAGGWAVALERDGGPALLCSVLSWLDGQELSGGLSAEQAAQAGQVLARLHLQAETFIPAADFIRTVYDLRYFMACWADLQRHLAGEDFSGDRRTDFQMRLEQLAQVLHDLKAVPGGFGLIHADVHPGNFLQGDAGLSLLDFDRCGWGPFMLDVADGTLDLGPPERDAFMAGYARLRSLPAESELPLRELKILKAVENLAFLSQQAHEIPFVLEALPVVERLLAEVTLGSGSASKGSAGD